MDFWPTEIVVTGWRCADPYWRPRPDCCRSQRRSRRHRVPVADRPTATSHRVGRGWCPLWSGPGRHRRLRWVSPCWRSRFRSSSHWGTRPRLPRPRLCRQPRLSSRIAARVVVWGTCKRSGELPDPGGKSANAFPFWLVPNPNVPDTLIPVLSPPAPAGTGPSRPTRGSAGDWSTAGYRHDRINSGDPHISQRFFDSIPGGSRSLPSFSLS